MGGKKRKIPIEKIEKESVRYVAFTKRRNGLFRKASELCRLYPTTQIAILATPLSSNSHVSFYSFGHSSVDHVVSSLLHDHSPALPINQLENSLGLGFWWEDKGFDMSENVNELKEAVDAVTMMLNNVKLRLDDAVKSNQRDGGLVIHQEKEEVLHELHNEVTKNHNPILEGESSGFASLLENEEANLQVDDFLNDFNVNSLN